MADRWDRFRVPTRGMPTLNLTQVGAALAAFDYVDRNPGSVEAAWRQVHKESDEYVIGYYDGHGYRAWELLYSELVLPSMCAAIVARHQSAADVPMVKVLSERNIGTSDDGSMPLHLLRLWQLKS